MKVIVLIIFMALSAYSQVYETTVKEFRFKSTSKTIIDEETIKKSKAPDVTTLLQTHANISVSSSGFQKNGLFLRGGDSSHILILINGAPVFDSGTAQRTFNLNLMSVQNIRRIEVLRGAQTVLYGGQALAGVIKIETFSKIPQEVNLVQAKLGNYDFQQFSLVTQKKWGDNNYLQASIENFHKKNGSPILNSKEVYPQLNTNADLAYQRRGSSDLTLRVFSTQDKSYLPGASAGYKAVDTEDLSQSTQFNGATLSFVDKSSTTRPELALALTSGNRKFAQPMNDTNVFGMEVDEYYTTQMQNVRSSIHVFDQDNLLVLMGLSYFKEGMIYKNMGVEKANKFGEQRGIFSKVDYNINENYEIEAGARVENTTHYNSEPTSQLGVTLFQQTKFEYATAFRVPSLFQYYGSYGNLELKPERSTSYTLTHDITFSEGKSLSVAGFHTMFSNLIITKNIGGVTKYYNINRSRATGVELLYSSPFLENFTGFFRYTYQESKDQDTGARLPRRPWNAASVGLSKEWDSQNVGLELVYFGDRETPITSKTNKTLSEYSLAHVFWNLKLHEQLQASFRVNNLFNTRYEESYNYFGEGRFMSAGLAYNF